MRIAIYHPWIYLKSGLERTILEIYRRSRHSWTIYTSHFDAAGTYPELSEMNVVELPRVSVNRRYGAVINAAARIATTRLEGDHDVLVISCDGLGSLLNFRNHTKPSVCLCFTPLRAVYDEEYRNRHLGRQRWAVPFALTAEQAYRWVDRAAWRRYSGVVCISETVRKRVAAGGLCELERMEVAYPGIPASQIQPSTERENYFLLPGRIMWTKNIELGINAFKSFRQETGRNFRLIIAGMVDQKSEPYFMRLQALAASDPAIEFLINQSDEQLQRLYRRCYATLLTAFNEDLGLTPLEAGCHGKPSIAVARGGPTELIVDGQTGLLVEPEEQAYAAAMTRIAADPARAADMGLQAAERCRRFTWEHYVEWMDDYLEQFNLTTTATD
jgi:glycosyltransferase involved in cell wall biosynthesis